MGDEPVDPPGVRGRDVRDRGRHYSQTDVDGIVQRALREQADAYAFSGLKQQVDRLVDAVGEFKDEIEELRKSELTELRGADGRLQQELRDHDALPMHKGTREMMAELGIPEMSHEERQSFSGIVKGAVFKAEASTRRAEFWASAQVRWSLLTGTLALLIAAVSLLINVLHHQ